MYSPADNSTQLSWGSTSPPLVLHLPTSGLKHVTNIRNQGVKFPWPQDWLRSGNMTQSKSIKHSDTFLNLLEVDISHMNLNPRRRGTGSHLTIRWRLWINTHTHWEETKNWQYHLSFWIKPHLQLALHHSFEPIHSLVIIALLLKTGWVGFLSTKGPGWLKCPGTKCLNIQKCLSTQLLNSWTLPLGLSWISWQTKAQTSLFCTHLMGNYHWALHIISWPAH